MHPVILKISLTLAEVGTRMRRQDHERGEGVVSVAIAVLIMAALGAVAWTAFQGLFDDTVDSSRTQIENIGNG
jgi:divalent metal cation (Fe/Co/Zn/Cd) transporter